MLQKYERLLKYVSLQQARIQKYLFPTYVSLQYARLEKFVILHPVKYSIGAFVVGLLLVGSLYLSTDYADQMHEICSLKTSTGGKLLCMLDKISYLFAN